MWLLPRQKKSADPTDPHARIEELLRKSGAEIALEKLVDRKCNRQYLLTILHLIVEPPFSDEWEAVVGLPPRKIKPTVLKRLETCAQDIESMNAGWHLWAAGLGSDAWQKFKTLPELLRLYAIWIQEMFSYGGPKRHPVLKAQKCILVQYVKQATGLYCDDLVAHLLAAVLQNEDYSGAQHGNWRREHCQLRKLDFSTLDKKT